MTIVVKAQGPPEESSCWIEVLWKDNEGESIVAADVGTIKLNLFQTDTNKTAIITDRDVTDDFDETLLTRSAKKGGPINFKTYIAAEHNQIYGGTNQTDGDYEIHRCLLTFTGTGTTPEVLNLEVLIYVENLVSVT